MWYNSPMINGRLTPEEITKMGEEYYFSKLQSKLEPIENGKYIVLDVESKDYVINADLMSAVNEAQRKHPNSLFYIAPIGLISRPTMSNFQYAWQLSK